MVLTLIVFSILGFILITLFNVSSFLVFGIAFVVYLASGGWKFWRVFCLTVGRDLRA